MNVSLTPELEELVRSKVDSGMYLSASEVVREALRLLQDQDKLRQIRFNELREDIQKGLDSGPSELLDMKGIKAQAREDLAKKK